MAKAYYVKFETPEELVSPILEALRVSATSGKVVRGTNEATKAIERGISKLIIIAEDVEVLGLRVVAGEFDIQGRHVKPDKLPLLRENEG